MPTVEVVVSEGQKDDWKTFVEHESSKYDSLSDLVRTAVEEQIARDMGDDGVPEEIEDMFFQLEDQFETLQSKIALTNETLDTIQNQRLDEETVDEIVAFHRDLIQDELENLNSESADEGGGDDA